MRVFRNHSLAVALLAGLLAAPACQTTHPAALLPAPQANAPALTPPVTAAPEPDAKLRQPETAPPAPNLDPVELLVTNVDKEYQSGLANQYAGNLDAAKENFDNAATLLTGAPQSLQSDPRVVQETDLVLTAIESLEPQVASSTDSVAAQKSEPAPIDEANDATPAVDPNVEAKAAAEIKVTHSDLPLMMTDPVASYINYFSGRGRYILQNGLARSGRYDAMIRSTLKEEGIPQDLIYLAQAESGFHPTALSRAGARGLWQFMAGRGRAYGLQRTSWVDDRQDPEKSTRAAAHHLKDLYDQFGDWYLAMAAYNSGPGTVQNAVKRTGYADFWELYKRNVLPKETRNYVPIILAVTIMAKNPAQYGLTDVVAEKPVPADSVEIDYPVDLRLVAQCIDQSPATLQDLNPSLLRWTTPAEGTFVLRLPQGSKEQYLSAIAAIPQDQRLWWRYHKVLPNDTLASLAHAYRTTPQAIARVNELDSSAALLADTKLIIPIAPGKHGISEDSETYSRLITRYHVRRGDTVLTVADNFGVPPTMVRRWNGLRGDSLRGRRVLYVHLPVAPGSRNAETHSASKYKSGNSLHASAKDQVVRHKVQPGETLSSIASNHHTTVKALKRDNNIATLRPGMILLIRPTP